MWSRSHLPVSALDSWTAPGQVRQKALASQRLTLWVVQQLGLEKQANLKGLGSSRSDAPDHLLTKASRHVVAHMAGGRLLGAEGADQDLPCPARRLCCQFCAEDVQEKVNDLVIKALQCKTLRVFMHLMISSFTGLHKMAPIPTA